jgi:hypothetical protein
LVVKRGEEVTRMSRPSSTNLHSGVAAEAPNWMVSWATISFGVFDAPHVADDARHQAGIGEMADPHRAIDAVLDQIDHAIRQTQFAAHVRIALEIARDQRRDMKASEPDRCRHHQPPAGRRPLGLRRGFGLLDVGEDAPGPLEITCADIGQHHRSRGPLQQPCAEALFQRRDQPRHAGRRQPQFARRGREPLQVGNQHKGLHGVDAIHGIIS